jgi:hypothetical protein
MIRIDFSGVPIEGLSRSLEVSAWIPLSDATVKNGCMFLLPAGISREISDAIDTGMPLSPRVVRAALQDVIALPAAAGAMIGGGRQHPPLGRRQCRRRQAPFQPGSRIPVEGRQAVEI